MRYQGDQMGSVEVEARWPVLGSLERRRLRRRRVTPRTDRNGLSTARRTSAAAAWAFATTLARKFGMDVGLDVARSSGTTAFYILVGNAWFRP